MLGVLWGDGLWGCCGGSFDHCIVNCVDVIVAFGEGSCVGITCIPWQNGDCFMNSLGSPTVYPQLLFEADSAVLQ
jgi:hypothetical protein